MTQRIDSVDILRGITIAVMILVNTPGDWSNVYAPFLHANWHGLTPTDLIFPFFLFIVGISISYAYKKAKNEKSTYKKILIRSLKLIGLGLFLNLFSIHFPFIENLETARIPGVLQRIGLVFFISSVLFLNLNWKALIGVSFSILVGYWIFTGFIQLPDGSLPTFDRATNNWANFVDLQFLKNHTWKSDYDPEGILSTFPSIVTCLFGILIGKLLQLSAGNKSALLFSSAILFLVLGYTWSFYYPLNKALWTGSFVFVTSGWATLILTLIYYISDVKKIKFGHIFKYAGTNAITVYFLSNLFSKIFYTIQITDSDNLHSLLYRTFYTSWIVDAKVASLCYAFTVTGFYLAIAYVMYRKKWILKV